MHRMAFIRKIFLNIVSALVAAFVASCEQTQIDTGFEMSPDSRTQALLNTVNGMTYEFYLLNNMGEKTSVFKEGEDFTMCFYITNNSGQGMFYDVDYYQPENGIFTVFGKDGKNWGSANRQYGRLAIEYYMEPGWRWGIEASWIALAYEVGDYDEWMKFFPNPNVRKPLPKGEYYTEYTYAFKHSTSPIPTDAKATMGPLTFRINFKIE